MPASRAHVRSFFSFMNIPAVPALPFNSFFLFKNSTVLYIFKKLSVSFFMFFLNFSNFLKAVCNFIKAFFSCCFFKVRV